jgi:hypothetical protein
MGMERGQYRSPKESPGELRNRGSVTQGSDRHVLSCPTPRSLHNISAKSKPATVKFKPGH